MVFYRKSGIKKKKAVVLKGWECFISYLFEASSGGPGCCSWAGRCGLWAAGSGPRRVIPPAGREPGQGCLLATVVAVGLTGHMSGRMNHLRRVCINLEDYTRSPL